MILTPTKFTDAAQAAEVVWWWKLADIPRANNRAAIDRLANGFPPLTENERIAAGANTNVNFLSLSKLLADARRTFYGAHLKPGVFFNVTVKYGDPQKRGDWSTIITNEINDVMKNSKSYFECIRSQFAMVTEHGIGPVFWKDCESWCPSAKGIEDVLIPTNTLLTMENLSQFAIFNSYTPAELYRLTHGAKVDPAWNIPKVEAAIQWAMEQPYGNAVKTSRYYQPEKWESLIKQDSAFYGSDAVATIDTWNLFYWSNEGNVEGWRMKVIIDTPATGDMNSMPDKDATNQPQGDWLYNPKGKRVYADTLEQIIHFQFGDASSVAPFKYHSVRSLGWLLYAVCHLQNRLRCKINDACFESLLQYFRVANADDMERTTHIDLHNHGVIPQDVTMVPPSERWKVDAQLIEMVSEANQGDMNEAAAQYRNDQNGAQAGTEKTATQVMAEVNAASALVGGMLLQSYEYSKYQQIEICRRFCIQNSSDPDVRKFRVNVLKQEVPETALDSSCWTIEPERVMGNGNKVLEVAMADKLMAARPMYDPDAQREILHIYTAANSDQPDLADRLVPQTPKQSDTVQIASNMIGSLMQGVQIPPASGLNPTEVIETLIRGMAMVLKNLQSGTPSPHDIAGAANIGQTIGQWINLLAQDKTQAAKVKQYGATLADLNRAVDEIGKQVQPAANNGVDPVTQAKVAGVTLQAQTKAQLTQAAGQQKLQQKEVAFQQKTVQTQQKHRQSLQQQLDAASVDTATTDLKTAADIRAQGIKAKNTPKPAP